MKKEVANIIAAAAISAAATFIATSFVCQVKTEKYVTEQLYARTGIVTEVNRKADYVIAECANGNKYHCYGAHDYEEGDIISLIAKENLTKRVSYDEVINHRYDGFIELLEGIETE